MVKVLVTEVKRFIIDCLRTAGANLRPAWQQADLLTYADKLGHYALGLNTLNSCVYKIESGLCSPNNKPKILKQEKSTAWIDAQHVMGATAGQFAMDQAIKMANKTGVGRVAATGCYEDTEPFSYWVKQATTKGLFGMVVVAPSTSLCEQQCTSAEPKYIESGKSDLVPVSDVRFVYKTCHNGEQYPDTPISDIFTPSERKRGLETIVDIFKGMPGQENLQERKNLEMWSTDLLAKDIVRCFIAVNPTCLSLGFFGRPVECIHYWNKWDEIEETIPNLSELFKISDGGIRNELEEVRTLDYVVKQINGSLVLAHKLGVKPMVFVEE